MTLTDGRFPNVLRLKWKLLQYSSRLSSEACCLAFFFYLCLQLYTVTHHYYQSQLWNMTTNTTVKNKVLSKP